MNEFDQAIVEAEESWNISEPLWKGPYEDGITQSMLGSFLNCRERFRVSYVLGLQKPEQFNKAIEYGNMWHVCKEYYDETEDLDYTFQALKDYARELGMTYPLQVDEVAKWYRVCMMQFEIYLKYLKETTSDLGCTIVPIEDAQEIVFKEPYELPDGRVVLLRGKIDSAKWIEFDKKQPGGFREGIALGEEKSKSDNQFDPTKITTHLDFDKQVMMYLIALDLIRSEEGSWGEGWWNDSELYGVYYNVAKRPLSGGKGTIRQRKATKNKPEETLDEYYERLRGIIEENRDEYFAEWLVRVTPKDIERFKAMYLNPILTQVCDWWDWVSADPSNPFREGNSIHWIHPFGCYNPVNEGQTLDTDHYIKTGDTTGLVRAESVFRELAE